MPAWFDIIESPDAALRGRRVRLAGYEPFVVGRSVENELVPPSHDRLGRRHIAFHWREATRGWEVRDYGSTNGTLLDGAKLSSALLGAGMRVELPGGHVFRFGFQGAQEQRHEALEAQLAGGWSDEAAQVYADWLLQHEEPLGEWMRASGAEPAPALASRFARSVLPEVPHRLRPLQLRWRHGFISEARVGREQHDEVQGPDWALEPLLSHPLARFLSVLELDPSSFEGRPVTALPSVAAFVFGAWEREVPALLERWLRQLPKSLERLSFVKLPRRQVPVGFAALEARVRERCPRLVGPLLSFA